MAWSCFKKSSSIDITSEPELYSDSKSFFVIATVFNPASYESRYNLYRNFARHMNETGAQLMTIECIFPSLNQDEFQVTDSSNPFHIQLKSDSIYWMKENLINIAVSRLPSHAKWVCWLDADLTFHESNWVDLTIKSLKKYSVVQIFKKAKFLGPPPENKVLRTDYSFGYSVVHGKIIDQQRYEEWYPHPGYGWAMSVSNFRYIGGLPEYDIMGSGDLHFAFSLINKISNAVEKNLNPQFKTMILEHCEQTFQKLLDISQVDSKSIVGYVPMNISHNWHGSRKDRQYVDRWKVLIAHDFNFLVDTQKKGNGLLELNPSKPFLQKDILAHFQMRQEDRNKTDELEDFKKERKRNQEERRHGNYGHGRDHDHDHHDQLPYLHTLNYACPVEGQVGNDFEECHKHNRNSDNCPVPSHYYENNSACPRPDDTYDYGGDRCGYAVDYHGTVQCTSQY